MNLQPLKNLSRGASVLHCTFTLGPPVNEVYWKSFGRSSASMLLFCYLAWPGVPPSPLQECSGCSPTWRTYLLAYWSTPWPEEMDGVGIGLPANNSPHSDSTEVTWHMYSANQRTLQQRKKEPLKKGGCLWCPVLSQVLQVTAKLQNWNQTKLCGY